MQAGDPDTETVTLLSGDTEERGRDLRGGGGLSKQRLGSVGAEPFL